MFKHEVLQQFIAHAIASYPNECCGLIVDKGTKYVPMRNVHEHPRNNFRMNMDDFRVFYEAGRVDALMHSHTGADNGHPSKQDMLAQQSMALPWGIVHINDHQDIDGPFFFGDQVPIAPLVGRKFRANVHDCYTLLRDVYRQELGATLPLGAREAEWWKSKQDLLTDNFKKAGFVQIDASQAALNDIMICRVNSPMDNPVPNHVIILRQNGQVLHHLSNRLSRHDPYSLWRTTAVSYLRYKGA